MIRIVPAGLHLPAQIARGVLPLETLGPELLKESLAQRLDTRELRRDLSVIADSVSSFQGQRNCAKNSLLHAPPNFTFPIVKAARRENGLQQLGHT